MKEIHSCLCKIDFNNVSATKCQPNICNSFSFLPVKKKICIALTIKLYWAVC